VSSFADRLAERVRKCQNPVIVGLDPRYDRLPAIFQTAAPSYGQQADAYRAFCCEVIDAIADKVPAVKPQMAFFEQLGPAGMSALGAVIRYAHQRQLLVILDGKRNDIGSTAIAYAQAYLGEDSAWQADCLTINPYLGDDSLSPFVECCWQADAGVFVLVKTSNPGGRNFQDLVADDRPLYRHVAELVERFAEATVGDCGYGAVGAVVGATYPQQLAELRAVMPHAWLLVPGYGAQGGAAEDVRDAFDAQGLGAVINSSRAIIFAHSRPEFAHLPALDWQSAVAAATDAMIAQLQASTAVGRLRS
jgi:orotidine-5'-phosphate decarboxylase